jgi:pimeloyl-ACP methyl ester carboxylesterase
MDVETFTAHRRSVTTPSGDIAYTELGTGPAALFIHGIGTSGALWRHVIEELRDTSRCIAVDLPLHGGSPARDDLSATALAQAVADFCDTLGLAQVDLVGNDTGGAVAQIFAASHPDRIRSFTLTNCDCEGNFPPAEFVPIVEAAKAGTLAETIATLATDIEAWRALVASTGFEQPDRVSREVWRAYSAPVASPEGAQAFERLLAALDPAEMDGLSEPLGALDAPVLIVWGTGDATFGVKWAYYLKDLFPGAQEVVEVDGAKIFFPEERPGDLVPHLGRFWGR